MEEGTTTIATTEVAEDMVDIMDTMVDIINGLLLITTITVVMVEEASVEVVAIMDIISHEEALADQEITTIQGFE